eukprot:TRINITY_DN14827_c0_g1_i3.p1 TRINITY_DN14827_c0_g1~~TRINITY_DN14827_c0_g1_i3.p1  ORF type:complete len:450 (+),score=113.11 TRINITY_DN14827_c0_g1_i3:86-1435(+)
MFAGQAQAISLQLPLTLPLSKRSRGCDDSRCSRARSAKSCRTPVSAKSGKTPVSGKRVTSSNWFGRLIRRQPVKINSAKSPAAVPSPGSVAGRKSLSRGRAKSARRSPKEAKGSLSVLEVLDVGGHKRRNLRCRFAQAVTFLRSGGDEPLAKQLPPADRDDDVSTTCSTNIAEDPWSAESVPESEVDGMSPRERHDVESLGLSCSAAAAELDVAAMSREELRLCLLQGGSWARRARPQIWPKFFASPPLSATSEQAVTAEIAKAIELDIPRTCSSLEGSGCDMLRRVLTGFAAQRPEIGYCQGLNFMAAVFLGLDFDEDAALLGLRDVVDRFCPGYHGLSLEGYRRDARVLSALVRRVLPQEVQQRLDDLGGVPLEVLAMEHFLTLGAASWPVEAVARLWDVLLVEAFKDRVAAAACKDMDGILQQTYVLLRQVDQAVIDHYRFIYSGC